MRILFWNMYRKDLSSLLVGILQEKPHDVVVVAEFNGNPAHLLQALNTPKARYIIPLEIDTRFLVLTQTRIPFEPKVDYYPRYSFWKVGRGKQSFMLCAVHLVDPQNHDIRDRNGFVTRLRRDIEKAEQKLQHRRTVVIGDFNLNPYDEGMISSEGLHAISSLAQAKRQSRIVQHEERRYFYNPMWAELGDRPLPTPGTHFNATGSVTPHWHMLDQVLFRPAMTELFPSFNLEIIVKSGDNSLLNELGRPNDQLASDHLPISIHFHMEQP